MWYEISKKSESIVYDGNNGKDCIEFGDGNIKYDYGCSGIDGQVETLDGSLYLQQPNRRYILDAGDEIIKTDDGFDLKRKYRHDCD